MSRSRLVAREQTPWEEVIPANFARWRATKITLAGAQVLTARNGPVTVVVRKDHGVYIVTKLRGGRELARRVTQRPPARIHQAFRKARSPQQEAA